MWAKLCCKTVIQAFCICFYSTLEDKCIVYSLKYHFSLITTKTGCFKTSKIIHHPVTIVQIFLALFRFCRYASSAAAKKTPNGLFLYTIRLLFKAGKPKLNRCDCLNFCKVTAVHCYFWHSHSTHVYFFLSYHFRFPYCLLHFTKTFLCFRTEWKKLLQKFYRII